MSKADDFAVSVVQAVQELKLEFQSFDSLEEQIKQIIERRNQLINVKKALDKELKKKWRIDDLVHNFKEAGRSIAEPAVKISGMGLQLVGTVTKLSGLFVNVNFLTDFAADASYELGNSLANRSRGIGSSKPSEQLQAILNCIDYLVIQLEEFKFFLQEIIQDVSLRERLLKDSKYKSIQSFAAYIEEQSGTKIKFDFNQTTQIEGQLREINRFQARLDRAESQLIELLSDSTRGDYTVITVSMLKVLASWFRSSLTGLEISANNLNPVITFLDESQNINLQELLKELSNIANKIEAQKPELNRLEEIAEKCLREPKFRMELAKKQKTENLVVNLVLIAFVLLPIICLYFIGSSVVRWISPDRDVPKQRRASLSGLVQTDGDLLLEIECSPRT